MKSSPWNLHDEAMELVDQANELSAQATELLKKAMILMGQAGDQTIKLKSKITFYEIASNLARATGSSKDQWEYMKRKNEAIKEDIEAKKRGFE